MTCNLFGSACNSSSIVDIKQGFHIVVRLRATIKAEMIGRVKLRLVGINSVQVCCML